MSEKRKRNIIICSLCGVLLLMVVGYAAFSTLLNIEGTTSISSNWNILITNVEEKNKIGEASTVEGYPTYENLTAEFQTNLVSPGDSIEYDITIENKGNLNAELARIKVSENDNEAIKFTTSGLEEGNILEASGSATLTVKVEYSDEVTSQPESNIAGFRVKLDYVQQGHKSEWTPSDETASEMLIKKVTTQGDGLYSDTYEQGRYVYRGKSPNNYITFNNEMWRIVSVEADETIKIMKEPSQMLPTMVFDSEGKRVTGYCGQGDALEYSYGCNAWAKTELYTSADGRYTGEVSADSSLKVYLNETYYNSISKNKTAIQKNIWYYGGSQSNVDLATQIKNEHKFSTLSNIGLISVSEYIRSNSNDASCGTYQKYNSTICKNTTWMFPTSGYYWTLTPRPDTSGCVLNIGNDSAINQTRANRETISAVPSLYLKSDIELEGEGTEGEPYTIKNYIN